MKLKEVQDALLDKTPLYIVRLKDYTVKWADKDPNNQRKKIQNPLLDRGNEIHYTVPTVCRVFVTDIDILKNRATCIDPIAPYKDPEFANSYIDYGYRKIESLYSSFEEADSHITEEMISKYVTPQFVAKYPQILFYHDKLKAMYPEGPIKVGDEDASVKEPTLAEQFAAIVEESNLEEEELD